MIQQFLVNKTHLASQRILVTRPKGQAQGLLTAITNLGGVAISLPTIDIVELEDKQALIEGVIGLDKIDIAIFVSRNAVAFAMPLIKAHWPQLPPSLQLAAIGRGTQAALINHGLSVTILPEQGANSEALLAEPALQQVMGKQITIFAGMGGRTLLVDTLRQRGVSVTKLDCYRRCSPEYSEAEIQQRLTAKPLDLVIATSNEGLENLIAILGKDRQAMLFKTPLIVISQRMRAFAEALGWQGIIVESPDASDEAIIKTITRYIGIDQYGKKITTIKQAGRQKRSV